MAWNFPTWQFEDDGTASSPRGDVGAGWCLGSSSTAINQHPFTNSLTVIGAFLIRGDYTDQTGLTQEIVSIGKASGNVLFFGCRVWNYVPDTSGSLQVIFRDPAAGPTVRYNYTIQDEDGVSKLTADKWFQFVITADSTSFDFMMNGTETPKSTEVVNTPGDLNLDNGSDRLWVNGSASATAYLGTTSTFCSVVLGPMALHRTRLDLTDSTVQGRIYDSGGNLKNPGADGSLWFGDTYSGTVPDLWLPDGTPRFSGDTWSVGQSASGHFCIPGGLRADYE